MIVNTVLDVEQFIVEFISDESDMEIALIDPESDFIETGLLDSFAILNMIISLEAKFKVKFEPQELANKDLRIIKSLAKAVAAKLT